MAKSQYLIAEKREEMLAIHCGIEIKGHFQCQY